MENKWIPVTERFPEVEQEVLITTKTKCRNGKSVYSVSHAIYEDGTVLEKNSRFKWHGNLSNTFIPEGWCEIQNYRSADCYDNWVWEEVIAWKPLPEPYKGENNHNM